MVHPISRLILVVVSALLAAGAADIASAEIPAGFPTDACRCIVEFDDAGALFAELRTDRTLEPMLALMGASDAAELLEDPALVDHGGFHAALLADGTIGSRTDEQTGDIEWVAWVGPGALSAPELMASLKPVRVLDRLVLPGLDIGLCQVGKGVLLSSEPPGALRRLALERIGKGGPAIRCSARAALERGAPVVVTFKHDPPLGGASAIAFDKSGDAVEVEYRGRFAQGMVRPPTVDRTLDVEVLDRMPEDVIAVVVEHSDAGILPGEGVVSRLLPHLVEPEPSDERRSRRLLVVSETQPEDGSPIRLPALAVAIEVDGPGASARRQDLAVLASLNTLRNRIGANAGLQHLPSLEELPSKGTRTIYTQALLDPAFDGHPLAKCVSANWCLTKGPGNWQLYATTPELAERVAVCLETPEGDIACVRAAHAGRLDTTRAVEHLRSWSRMAEVFVGEDMTEAFGAAVEMLTEMLQGVKSLDWTITVPNDRALDATIRLLPRKTEAALE